MVFLHIKHINICRYENIGINFDIFEEKKLSMSKFSEIINGDTPVLVDFYADWCQPCKMMAPILKQVKDSLGDKIKIIKIDTDKNPQLSERYNIRSIPTMILFKKGEQTWNNSGVMQANQLIENLKYYIN